MSASGAIGAASIRSERRIVETLRAAKALSPEAAIPLPADGLLKQGAMARLIGNGAVVEIAGQTRADDHYWLNEEALSAARQLRLSRFFLILFGIAAALLVVSAVTIAKT